MRNNMLKFAVIIMSLFFASGCGGDSASLSQKEYLQQLELVCNEGVQKREELVSAINLEVQEQEQPVTTQDQIDNLRKLINVYQGTTEEIDQIGLPEQNLQKAEELIRAREEAAAKVDASPLGTRDNLAAIFVKADELANKLEVESCAF